LGVFADGQLLQRAFQNSETAITVATVTSTAIALAERRTDTRRRCPLPPPRLRSRRWFAAHHFHQAIGVCLDAGTVVRTVLLSGPDGGPVAPGFSSADSIPAAKAPILRTRRSAHGQKRITVAAPPHAARRSAATPTRPRVAARAATRADARAHQRSVTADVRAPVMAQKASWSHGRRIAGERESQCQQEQHHPMTS